MFYAMSRYFYLEFALTAMVALSIFLLLATVSALAIMLIGKKFNRRKALLLLGIYALFLLFVGTQVRPEFQEGIGKPIGGFLKNVADGIGNLLP